MIAVENKDNDITSHVLQTNKNSIRTLIRIEQLLNAKQKNYLFMCIRKFKIINQCNLQYIQCVIVDV